MKTSSRIFSLEEANALIPQIEKILSEIDAKKENWERLHDLYFLNELVLEAVSPSHSEKWQDDLEKEALELDETVLEFRKSLHQIESIGCILRYLDSGLVEFPSEKEGHLIYLSWIRGEKTVNHYRSPEERMSERHLLAA